MTEWTPVSTQMIEHVAPPHYQHMRSESPCTQMASRRKKKENGMETLKSLWNYQEEKIKLLLIGKLISVVVFCYSQGGLRAYEQSVSEIKFVF